MGSLFIKVLTFGLLAVAGLIVTGFLLAVLAANGLSVVVLRNAGHAKIKVDLAISGDLEPRSHYRIGPGGTAVSIFFVYGDRHFVLECADVSSDRRNELTGGYLTPGLVYYPIVLDGCDKAVF